MDDEDQDDQTTGRKLAIKSLIAHLGYDNDGDENVDSGDKSDDMDFSNLTTEAQSFGKKKKGGGGGGGGGMGGMGGMDISSMLGSLGGGGAGM